MRTIGVIIGIGIIVAGVLVVVASGLAEASEHVSEASMVAASGEPRTFGKRW